MLRDPEGHALRRAALERWERELVRPLIEGLLDRIAPLGRADLVRDVGHGKSKRGFRRVR